MAHDETIQPSRNDRLAAWINPPSPMAVATSWPTTRAGPNTRFQLTAAPVGFARV